jgi:hypothetical protein
MKSYEEKEGLFARISEKKIDICEALFCLIANKQERVSGDRNMDRWLM